MCISTAFRMDSSTFSPLQLGRRAVCSVCVFAVQNTRGLTLVGSMSKETLALTCCSANVRSLGV